MSSLDHSKLEVFSGTLGRHPKSSSKDGLQLRSLADQSETWGKGPFGQALFKSIKSMHTHHFPLFFFTTIVLAKHSG